MPEALRTDSGVGRVPNAVRVDCVVVEEFVGEVCLAFAEEVGVVFVCSVSHCLCNEREREVERSDGGGRRSW